MVLNEFQSKADGFVWSPIDRHPRTPEQQAVRVVKFRPIAASAVQLFDIRRAEIVGLDYGLDLVEGASKAARIQALVMKNSHAGSAGRWASAWGFTVPGAIALRFRPPGIPSLEQSQLLRCIALLAG